MTIVEKVIKLLTNYGQMSLFEIYDALPEHTEASIRGNINRYISKKGKEALIKRVDKGIYSVVEIISVEEKGIRSIFLIKTLSLLITVKTNFVYCTKTLKFLLILKLKSDAIKEIIYLYHTMICKTI